MLDKNNIFILNLRIMKKSVFFIFFILGIFSSHAQQLVQDKSETKVEFKVKNFGVYVSGSFSEVDIISFIDISDLESSYINAVIQVGSINTGNVKRDKHLLKNDFFDADHFPILKLKSTKIEKLSETNFILKGKLTIKNTTKIISVPLELILNNDSIIITSNFKINRRDYDVGGNIWVLGNNVKITVVYKARI